VVDFGNSGCWDGYQPVAFKWLFEENGGIASEEE
jgi:hypothetical protein